MRTLCKKINSLLGLIKWNETNKQQGNHFKKRSGTLKAIFPNLTTECITINQNRSEMHWSTQVLQISSEKDFNKNSNCWKQSIFPSLQITHYRINSLNQKFSLVHHSKLYQSLNLWSLMVSIKIPWLNEVQSNTSVPTPMFQSLSWNKRKWGNTVCLNTPNLILIK